MDLLNIQIANKDNRILDWQHFVKGGGEHPVSRDDPNMIVIIGEEYRPPFWGHVNYMGLKDHLISPFTTGMGIYLTQVTPRCRILGDGRLSPEFGRVRGAFR